MQFTPHGGVSQYYGLIAVFENTTTGRFHPVAFSAGLDGLMTGSAIPAGGYAFDRCHGAGFATLAEVQSEIDSLNTHPTNPMNLPESHLFLDAAVTTLSWTGGDFPVDVIKPEILTLEGLRAAVAGEQATPQSAETRFKDARQPATGQSRPSTAPAPQHQSRGADTRGFGKNSRHVPPVFKPRPA